MVPQPEMGIQMRGSSDAAAALQLAQVPLPCLFVYLFVCVWKVFSKLPVCETQTP